MEPGRQRPTSNGLKMAAIAFLGLTYVGNLVEWTPLQRVCGGLFAVTMLALGVVHAVVAARRRRACAPSSVDSGNRAVTGVLVAASTSLTISVLGAATGPSWMVQSFGALSGALFAVWASAYLSDREQPSPDATAQAR